MSDVLILLRALVPLRGFRQFIVEPALPQYIKDLRFSITWLSSPRTQKYKFGEYIDSDWNDLSSFYWLTRCEIAIHEILHQLHTPIAPFLRVEQMSSVSHDVSHRLMRCADEFEVRSQICERAGLLLTAIRRCSVALAPWCGYGMCHCPGPEERYSKHCSRRDVFGEEEFIELICKERSDRNLYQMTYKAWKDEFHVIKARLEAANGRRSFGPFFGKGNLQPMKKLPGGDRVDLDQLVGFDFNEIWSSTTASDFLRERRRRCPCHRPINSDLRRQDAWVRRWTDEIVHDIPTIRSSNALHCHPKAYLYTDEDLERIYMTISPLRSGAMSLSAAEEECRFWSHV